MWNVTGHTPARGSDGAIGTVRVVRARLPHMTRRGHSSAAPGTPATVLLRQAGVTFTEHPYRHDPDVTSYGTEAVEALGVEASRVFKTLVVTLPRGLGVVVIPVDAHLDLKAAGAAFGVKRVTLAEVAQAERATGYVVGGISPLNQRTALPTVVDSSALQHDTVYVSGGRRGFDVGLPPSDLITLTKARTAPIARRGTP